MPRLDIDQKRAKYAFDSVFSVDEIKNEEKYDDAQLKKKQKELEVLKKKYGSQIESLPMMIHNSGLRNTLAFAYAKGILKDSKEWKLVFEHLTNWLKTEPTGTLTTLNKKESKDIKETPNDILKAIIDLADDKYRFATQETFALVNWLRKFVKGD